MDKKSLHAQVEALNFNDWKCRALIHAMIDYGKITTLECQLPDCRMDSRAFVARVGHTAGRGQPGGKGLVFDHIHPRLQGGSDRPENLRIIHAACNNARTTGRKDSPAVRAKKSAAAKARGGWQDANERRPKGWNRRLTAEAVREMRAEYRAGGRIRAIAAKHGVSYSTAHSAIHGKRWFAEVI